MFVFRHSRTPPYLLAHWQQVFVQTLSSTSHILCGLVPGCPPAESPQCVASCEGWPHPSEEQKKKQNLVLWTWSISHLIKKRYHNSLNYCQKCKFSEQRHTDPAVMVSGTTGFLGWGSKGVTSISSTWRWCVARVPWSSVRASSRCAFSWRLSLYKTENWDCMQRYSGVSFTASSTARRSST